MVKISVVKIALKKFTFIFDIFVLEKKNKVFLLKLLRFTYKRKKKKIIINK
jgi:hypothetical protein